ncbi:uroporphyrinogen-III synthase [Paludifilum halophilum]|uniref:Uroporphyrinogen-III synthase n=1 Tax=Paludifilum halophilum TaxID=1642702 RepID=A0A235B7I9_9BACL|nr:uroporphyrinogen-III synthase [Paludifilum halophilum]OYD08278.1 hypothetical protein CHM34_05345 [Paludifilum halophilum]
MSAGKENRGPLSGRKVLITRAKNQSESMARKIRNLGGGVVEFPAIRIAPPKKQKVLDQALYRLDTYDWLIFTSTNGVHFFFQRLRELDLDIRRMVGARIAAIGPKTAETLEKKGIQVDVLPGEYRAEALAKALHSRIRPGERILLPRANIARKWLALELERSGCHVTDADAYDTLPNTREAGTLVEMLRQGCLDILTFTSSSTVRNFVEAIRSVEPEGQHLLRQAQIACIGPVTADTARELGLRVDVTADCYTIDGLIEAVLRLPQI